MAQDNIIKFNDFVDKANELLSKHIVVLNGAADSVDKYIASAKIPSEYIKNLKDIDGWQKKIEKSSNEFDKEFSEAFNKEFNAYNFRPVLQSKTSCRQLKFKNKKPH